MLFGKYLGRRHQCRLIAVFHRGEHREKRDDRLAAADVALDQPVHRRVGLQVAEDLADDLFLGAGQREREAHPSAVSLSRA